MCKRPWQKCQGFVTLGVVKTRFQGIFSVLSYWPLLALLGFVSSALLFPIQDGDIFMYLAIAEKSLSLGQIPTLDPFLFSFKNWHIYHEWLSYFVWYVAYASGGLKGVIVFKSFLWIFAFSFLVWQNGIRKSNQALVLCFLFLASIAASHRFVEKASLFSDLFFLIVLVALLKPEKNWHKLRFIFPVLFLFWVNLHPGFVLGLILLSIYFLSELQKPTKHQWQSLGLSILACFLNPEFVRGFLYPFKTVLNSDWEIYHKINYEWVSVFDPLFFQAFEVKALLYLFLFTGLVLLGNFLKKEKKSEPQFRKTSLIIFSILVWGLLLVLCWKGSRFMTTASLGLSALALFAWPSVLEFKDNIFSRISTYLVGILFMTLALWIFSKGYDSSGGHREWGDEVDSQTMPVQAAEYFYQQKFKGRIFNEFGWGSYLAWKFSGDPEIFIHGHIDDPKILANDYFGIGKSKEFYESTIKKYGIKYFFLDVRKLAVEPPPLLLSFFGQSQILYQDDVAIILEVP